MIRKNPKVIVAGDEDRITQVLKTWLRVRGYTIISTSEYCVKGSRALVDPLTVVLHGGSVVKVIELHRYPMGDSSEIDLFAYTVGQGLYNWNQQTVETDKIKLAEYQSQLDSLASQLKQH